MKNNFTQFSLYIRALKHTSPQQLLERASYDIRSIYYLSPLYPFLENPIEIPKGLTITPPHLWKGKIKNAKEICAGNFTFTGRTIAFGKNINWQPTGASKLWIFRLHYFDWLSHLRAMNTEEARLNARDLIADWIIHNSKFNRITWHPYPLSRRVISWITFADWVFEGADSQFKAKFMESLCLQIDHLCRVTEWGRGGHHLIKNLKAQIYAGLCLVGHQSMYLDALTILLDELKLQILPDGGHFERSPMYHVEVLKDLLDIHAIILKAGQTTPARLDEVIERIVGALEFYRYPDGKLGLFNDSKLGEKLALDKIIKRCAGGEKVEQLSDTGYVKLKRGKTFVMFNGGKYCFNVPTDHVHADTLSFEMSIGTERVFVNSGTYGYQGNLRQHLRSTSASNTVCIDGENSAEVFNNFLLGRRPGNVHCDVREEKKVGIGVESSHDGYSYLGVKHSRRLFLSQDGSDLRGEDVITGTKSHKVTAHFHLAPDVKYSLRSNEEVIIETSRGTKLSFKARGGRVHDAASIYCPTFGKKIITRQLIIRGIWEKGKCTLKWAIKHL